MTLTSPKQLFAPYVLGSSLRDSYSFSPFTFFQAKRGPGIQHFIAKYEQNHSSQANTEASSTFAEAIGDADVSFLGLDALSANPESRRDYFAMKSNGRSHATISSSLELLQTLIIFCINPGGVMVNIWTRVEGEVFGTKAHVKPGITTLLSIEENQLLPRIFSQASNCEPRIFVSLELSEMPLHPVYIKPVRRLVAGQNGPSMYSFSPIPFGRRFHEDPCIFEMHSDAFCDLMVSRLSAQPSGQCDIKRAHYFDQFLGNKKTPNPLHLASMLNCQVEDLANLLSSEKSRNCRSLWKDSENKSQFKRLNYLVVMTPRSGSTALSEKMARLGIGCPTELTTGFFYNLFSHLETCEFSQSYIEYILELLRNPQSLISGIQIDPDRLSHTWDKSLAAVINKYIYFFRRSISKQGLSLSMAVHHNLWFAYDSTRYNEALEKLSIDEFRNQLVRLVKMNAYCLGHFISNREQSLILTNEQHLRKFDECIPLIKSHLCASSQAEEAKPRHDDENNALPQPQQPTQVVSGRNETFSAAKLSRFLDELKIECVADTLELAGLQPDEEVTKLYHRIFTV